MPIRQLPPVLVNRIAAGEVIERPAAAVKELVENAIDAGADRIEVTLREGGAGLIAVTDDGSGMDAARIGAGGRAALHLETARRRSAARSRTLGFRGEALPSIGAVSRLRIVRAARGGRSGLGHRGRGRRQARPHPGGAPAGTRVEVRDLFYRHAGAAQIPQDRRAASATRRSTR